jgi:hypothetical protein
MNELYCLSCGQPQTDILTCCRDDGAEVMTPFQMVQEIKRLRVALQLAEGQKPSHNKQSTKSTGYECGVECPCACHRQ